MRLFFKHSWRKSVEDFFKSAADYASRGWLSLRINGLADDEKTCTCKSGADCGTPGKHPVDYNWQAIATDDESVLADWFDGANYNIGVVLGEASGIVDIEWDDESGKETAERFGLSNIETPTFLSHRSEHRIFKYDPRLPQQAVLKIGGLEVRIGGGGKSAQSVFPPSLHASGVRYRWKYGYSPDEVDVAPIPDALMRAILNNSSTEVALRGPAAAILHKPAGEGERHSAMVRMIARMCIQMIDPHDAQEQQDSLAMARSINQTKCTPPLQDREIESIWRGQLRWAIKVRSEGGGPEFLKTRLDKHLTGEESEEESETVGTFTITGLEFRDNEWWPGSWRLRVIHSDPVAYILTVPVHVRGEDRFVDVTMDAETYRSAAKVAQAVLEATHTVILDDVPETWAQIWCGKGARKGQPAVRGLKAKLMVNALEEEATAENLRYSKVAGWLLDVLANIPEPGDEEEDPGSPDAGGRPAWVRSKDGVWELWFGWARAWEQVDRGRRKLEEGDQQKIKQMIMNITGEESFATGRHTSDDGASRRYIRFTSRHLRALEQIASGDVSKNHLTTRVEIGIDLPKSAGKVEKWQNSPEVVD
jgi:hypothetical protein